jgi:hypothetical protein
MEKTIVKKSKNKLVRDKNIKREAKIKRQYKGAIVPFLPENITVNKSAPLEFIEEIKSAPKQSEEPIVPIETQEKIDLSSKHVDKIDFFDDKGNSLTIKFSQCHLRKYRLQIFLNDLQEIRPITYVGSSTAFAFWSMLKGSMKK